MVDWKIGLHSAGTGTVGLAYFEYARQAGSVRWRLRVAWSHPTALMLEIFYTIMLLDQIWRVGSGEVGQLPDFDDWDGAIEWSPEMFSHCDALLEEGSGELVWDLDADDE